MMPLVLTMHPYKSNKISHYTVENDKSHRGANKKDYFPKYPSSDLVMFPVSRSKRASEKSIYFQRCPLEDTYTMYLTHVPSSVPIERT